MPDSKGVDSNPVAELLPSASILNRLAVSESGFIFDPASGHNFTVNETGLVLLRLMQQALRLDQILETLRNEFDADPREIERDVVEFVSALRENVGA
jgi:hypothetical protein